MLHGPELLCGVGDHIYTLPKLMRSPAVVAQIRLSALSVISQTSCRLDWMSFGQGSKPCSVLLSTGNGDNGPVLATIGVYPSVVHKLGLQVVLVLVRKKILY
jgi:hypothetical protein